MARTKKMDFTDESRSNSSPWLRDAPASDEKDFPPFRIPDPVTVFHQRHVADDHRSNSPATQSSSKIHHRHALCVTCRRVTLDPRHTVSRLKSWCGASETTSRVVATAAISRDPDVPLRAIAGVLTHVQPTAVQAAHASATPTSPQCWQRSSRC